MSAGNFKVGQTVWEVEWCSRLATLPTGEMIPENCEYSLRRFANEKSARNFAKKIFPHDGFGSVRITRCLAVDRFSLGWVSDFEQIEDSEHYEGEK